MQVFGIEDRREMTEARLRRTSEIVTNHKTMR